MNELKKKKKKKKKLPFLPWFTKSNKRAKGAAVAGMGLLGADPQYLTNWKRKELMDPQKAGSNQVQTDAVLMLFPISYTGPTLA